MQDDKVFTHFALLIGIDDYPDRPLKGCVRDVRGIKKHLDGIPEPNIVHKKLLTSSSIQGGAALSVEEDRSSIPTYDNFFDSIKWIISCAEEGAFVYIHFSGHGTAFRPPRPSSPSYAFSNGSTGDLALVLFQEDKSRIRYLRGTELAYLLQGLVDKKLLVTLVLDCCFSGSLMRTDSSVRYLDYDPDVDAAYPPSSGQSLGTAHRGRPAAYRGASLRPNWLINPDGYTVFTACGPTERAREFAVDGVIHGALSYFLSRTFTYLGGVGGRQGYLYYHVRSMFEKTKRQRQHEQNPMMYGNKDLGFFGPADWSIGPVSIPIICEQGKSYKLQAGRAHGVCAGDKLSVYAPLLIKPNQEGTEGVLGIISATITRVGALASEVEIQDVTPTQRGTVLMAMPITCISLREFPIRIDQSLFDLPEWKAALQEEDSLSIFQAGGAKTDIPHTFNVSMLNQHSYEIQDELGQQLVSISVCSDDPSDAVNRVVQALKHLARYELVRSLTNDSRMEETRIFEDSFSVRLLNSNGDEFGPGCKYVGRFHPKCNHRECVVEIEHGAQLWLEISNIANNADTALYIHVFNMSPAWEIENILRGDYEVVPPARTNQSEEFRKGTSGVWKKRLLMQKTEGYPGDDVIKIFVTRKSASFLSLELPELGRVNQRHVSQKPRDQGDEEISERWAAFSFRVHILAQWILHV